PSWIHNCSFGQQGPAAIVRGNRMAALSEMKTVSSPFPFWGLLYYSFAQRLPLARSRCSSCRQEERPALRSNPQLETARTATSEALPGTEFSTVVWRRAWKYGGGVFWSGASAARALWSSGNRSALVRYSMA